MSGIIIGIGTFLIIGLLHPIVIKVEYHFGTKCWWLFLLVGLVCIATLLFINSLIVSALLAVLGFSFLWSIHELFAQEKRVKKGWFPANPKRKFVNENKSRRMDKTQLKCGKTKRRF